jgi:hypothetical protein
MPWADALYGCEPRWWDVHKDCNGFEGEKWSTHDKKNTCNDKIEHSEKYGINLVKGAPGPGFSRDPSVISYGDNSGFQAINLAILFASPYIVLVGFDMSYKDKGHFFGDHPEGLFRQTEYEKFIRHFDKAAELLEGVTIINATPGSAMHSFPMMSLEEAISGYEMKQSA